jgi:hypothetical protein
MRSVSPATSTRALSFGLAFAGLLGVAALPSTTQAITIGVQASGGTPGSSVEVQVVLTGSNGLAAGMQTDISWDPTCVSVAMGGDTPACSGNTAIPKQLTTKLQSGANSLRALFFSMTDVDPIKDAVLFTCQFNIDPATTASQCPINLSNVIVSDSKGGRLPATAASGVVQISQSGSQQVAPQGGPGLPPAPVIVAPSGGGAGTGAGGQGFGGAPAAPAPAAGARGAGNVVLPGLPSAPEPAAQVPAAAEAAGAAAEAARTPGLLTPAPAIRTVAAAVTPPSKAGTPTAGVKTPTAATPHATTPPTTPTPRGGTPAATKSTPRVVAP